MREEIQIVLENEPDESSKSVIGQNIRSFNIQQAGEDNYHQLCLFLRAREKEIVGGLLGSTYYDWFYVSLLWVKEELRGNGYGHELLVRSEEEARRRGAKHAYLDTFSFQAPDFYRRHGYEIFGVLEDFPPGFQRYFLKKNLQGE